MIEAQKAQQVARGGEADTVAAFVALGGQVRQLLATLAGAHALLVVLRWPLLS